MTSGYILIIAILVLGGLLATLGDRIGSRVGKARLSLFKLRPRQTATLVAIITGSLISASTLGILFGLSESLREGIFELDNILQKLRHARRDIEEINTQKNRVENELAKTRAKQSDVQKRLDITNKNFQQAQAQLKQVSQQATGLRKEIQSLLIERQQLLQQREQLTSQIAQLNQQITQLKTRVAQGDQELIKRDQTIEERNAELAEQDEAISKLDKKIAVRDEIITQREGRLAELEQKLQEAIAQRETLLKELEQKLLQRETELADRDQKLEAREKQLTFLEREVETLEQYYRNYQTLRAGNVAILRGQVLASGVVRIAEPEAATEAFNQLLREANRTAREITLSSNGNSDQRVVEITQTQAEQLINQIKDGQDYVVRILSAANYVVGEKTIQVFADAALNQVIFQAGEVLAATSTDSSVMGSEEIQQRLDQLLAASEFRARRAGVLGKIEVADGDNTKIIRFIEQLSEYGQPLDVRAVVQNKTYAAGPLKMQLVATQNGEVVFRT
ncbi:DUF3084 domain-containing protein [Lyngbya aestuarii]|uniref:DUF3084 domain-containing protein n=1 Tax=Lyngbya aestuarii TaxID=118322 RepID=UPI00403D7664